MDEFIFVGYVVRYILICKCEWEIIEWFICEELIKKCSILIDCKELEWWLYVWLVL